MPNPRRYNLISLFALGLAGVAGYNWRLWRRDRALADRLRSERAPVPAPSRAPRVSTLVAAWNEVDHIDAHIQSFLALAYPNVELVICAGGADDTHARARRYAGERVIVLEQQPGEGKQRALARCYARAGGELIYLTDADCRFDDEALARLVAPIVDEGEQVTTGGSRPLDEQRELPLVQYQALVDLIWYRQLPATVSGILGRNCLVTRAALDRIQAFQVPAPTGTDYVMSRQLLRAGYRIRSVADSVVASEYPARPGAYLRMWRRWNKNLVVHGLRAGAWADVKGVAVAFVLYLGMLLLPLVALLVGLLLLPVSPLLVATKIANRLRLLGMGARLAGQRIPLRLLARVPWYVALDMLAVLLGVLDALHPRWRNQW